MTPGKKAGLLFFAVGSVAMADCIPLAGDRIFGRDLANADPRFASLPASLVLGWAPPPGNRRTFTPTELTRIAKSNGIEPFARGEICFEIPLQKLNAAEVLNEMRVAVPDAEVTVLEFSQGAVPAGKLEFPIAGLEPASASRPGDQLWRGFVRSSETKRTPVWARVRISQTLLTVVALKDLPANTPIQANSLRLEKRNAVAQNLAGRLEDVQGHIPRRAIRADEPISLALLEKAPDVRRGEVIPVEVRSGSARLQLSAVAERDARSGEILELRNPSSGKTFRAKLTGSRAVVLVGGDL
jgi:flagella basal body P-ring formation protein FlgA